MTTRALHFADGPERSAHHQHTTTIGGETVSDYGAYLHERQATYEAEAAEAAANPLPDLLKPKERPKGAEWTKEERIAHRNDPTRCAGIRVWHADSQPLPAPKGRVLEA